MSSEPELPPDSTLEAVVVPAGSILARMANSMPVNFWCSNPASASRLPLDSGRFGRCCWAANRWMDRAT